VNRHNSRICGKEDPHESFEHKRDSPKVNVFAAMSREKLYGPFFFIESTVTGIIYLDMLREWLMPQLQDDIPDLIYQQDGAPPHFHNEMMSYPHEHLCNRWIWRGGSME
jgi:hypothetical protein